MKLQKKASRRPVLEELEPRLIPSASALTYHNDNLYNGQNLQETGLTPANVNSTTFGKLFTEPVDGQVYAQPLVQAGGNIKRGSYTGIHKVVFVATGHHTRCAFDGGTGHL